MTFKRNNLTVLFFFILVNLFADALDANETVLNIDNLAQVNPISMMQGLQNPEIYVYYDGDVKKLQPRTDQKLSHSCGDMDSADLNPASCITSTSTADMTLNISQSQSESALKSKLQNLTSPVANVTKDLVLSPFSKLAKGVQNFSVNLDVRKLSVSGGRQITARELEETQKLQEMWKDRKTRLIML